MSENKELNEKEDEKVSGGVGDATKLTKTCKCPKCGADVEGSYHTSPPGMQLEPNNIHPFFVPQWRFTCPECGHYWNVLWGL